LPSPCFVLGDPLRKLGLAILDGGVPIRNRGARVHRWAGLPGRPNHGDRPPFHLVLCRTIPRSRLNSTVIHALWYVGKDFESILQHRCFNARFVCLKRVYGVCAGYQPYVTAFRHQHSRRLRRHANRQAIMPRHQATPTRRGHGCLWAKAGFVLGTLVPDTLPMALGKLSRGAARW
jgi:hypothetical protein